jgi:hypothetical protein
MTKLRKSLGFVLFDVGDDEHEVLRRIDVVAANDLLQARRLAEFGTKAPAEIDDAAWTALLKAVAAELMGESEEDWSSIRLQAFWDTIMAEVSRLKKAEPASGTPA